MRRINSLKDTLNTGEAELDVGDGQRARVPLGRAVRVDQSAGRVFKVWDYLNNREQIIYGDTGWRSITIASGTLQIRRVNQTVSVNLVNFRPQATGTVAIAQLPAGFRDAPTSEVFWADEQGSPRSSQIRGYSPFEFVILGLSTINSYVSASITYLTTDPWPTSLPGTAVGSIPS